MASVTSPITARAERAAPAAGPAEVTGIALGVLLLIDVLRAWLPSLITIYGDAGSTPPEQIGAFAAIWIGAPVLAVGAAMLIGADRLTFVAALGFALAVIAAGAIVSGRGGERWAQLYVLCAALLVGLVWLVSSAMTVRSAGRAAVGVTAGLGLSVGLHTALGTVDLIWRAGPVPAVAQATLACAFVGSVAAAGAARNGLLVAAQAGAGRASPVAGDDRRGVARFGTAGGGRVGVARPGAGGPLWLLVGPAIFVTTVVTGSTGLAEAAPGWSVGVAAGIVASAALLAIPVAAGPRRLTRHPVVAAVLLVGGVAAAIVPRFQIDGIAGLAPSWVVAGQALGALGLGATLGWVGAGSDARAATAPGPDRPARRGLAAWASVLLLAVLTFGYYGSYDVDLGFPNVAVPVLAAAGIAAVGMWIGPRARRWGAPSGPPRRLITLAAGALACAAAVVGAQAWAAPGRPSGADPVDDFPVRLVAYNIHAGIGLDGRFDPDSVAATVRAERPDVVLLSEVDRGWFVNGGHDTLQLLADRLGMRAVFAPAADPVWGDALLTRLPVTSIRSHPLPASGGGLGAEALAVVLEVGRHELAVVGTHLRPPPDPGSTAQAEAVAQIAKQLADHDRPVVVAGDLNIEPADRAFGTLLSVAGLLDGLADARPLPTRPSDQPIDEIDHVLTTPDLLVSEVAAPESTASDHRAVAVTLTYQSPEQLQPAD